MSFSKDISIVKYQRGAHTLHDIKYHFVWVTKYRYPVLRGEVALSVREYIRHVCMKREVAILKGHVGKDYISQVQNVV